MTPSVAPCSWRRDRAQGPVTVGYLPDARPGRKLAASPAQGARVHALTGSGAPTRIRSVMQTGGNEPSVSLVELATDVLLLGLQIGREAVLLSDVEDLRQRLLGLLRGFGRSAEQAGWRPADIEDAEFALSAYLDEVIQHSGWSQRGQWAAGSLQMTLYGESVAGERFFERLERARRRSSGVVAVYYQCLVLGFMGQYRVGEADELRLLISDLRRELDLHDPPQLCDLDSFVDDGAARARPLPWLGLAGICVVLAAVVVGALYYLSYTGFATAAEAVRSLTGR